MTTTPDPWTIEADEIHGAYRYQVASRPQPAPAYPSTLRCGYVGVREGHPLWWRRPAPYSLEYDLAWWHLDHLHRGPWGLGDHPHGAPRIAVSLDEAPGGVTYTGSRPGADGWWFVGWDHGHYFDEYAPSVRAVLYECEKVAGEIARAFGEVEG